MMDKFRNRLSELMVMTLKSRDPNKLHAANRLKECKEMFTEYFEAFNQAMTNGVINNVSLAKLNNVAYKGIIDGKIARELAKRTGEGQKYMEGMADAVKFALEGMDFKKLNEEYKDKVEEFGHCAISYQTCIEALQ